MTEAALHWIEYLGASDRDSALYADAVKLSPQGPTISPPPARTAFDQLSPDFMRIHQVGMIRALAPGLDCLAGVIIGVVALPENVLKASFKTARVKLKGIRGSESAGAGIQVQFAVNLENAIASAGPDGWLDWTLEFRNMLVHRGRRIELGKYVPIEPVLLGPNGRPVSRARRVASLPLQPDRSDIEALLDAPWESVLQEEAQQTLAGLLSSTSDLLERAAPELLKVWQWRRANPHDLRQPRSQWPNRHSAPSAGFTGYAPGSQSFKAEMGTIHPPIMRRFRAASLEDSRRADWDTFD